MHKVNRQVLDLILLIILTEDIVLHFAVVVLAEQLQESEDVAEQLADHLALVFRLVELVGGLAGVETQRDEVLVCVVETDGLEDVGYHGRDILKDGIFMIILEGHKKLILPLGIPSL